MKIKKIVSQFRFDFRADLECEHCGSVQRLNTGYDDAFYRAHVLPSITCKACGKDRAGNVPQEPNDEGFVSIGKDGQRIDTPEQTD